MNRGIRYAALLSLLVIASAATGQLLARRPPGGGCPTPRPGCVCAAIYEPVICDGACTYSNQCGADCAKATHCVPGDIGPQPL
jgi:hypothetical protein